MQIGFGWGKGRRVIAPAYTTGFVIRRQPYSDQLQRALTKHQRWVDACAPRPRPPTEPLPMAKAVLRPRG